MGREVVVSMGVGEGEDGGGYARRGEEEALETNRSTSRGGRDRQVRLWSLVLEEVAWTRDIV